MKEEAEPTKSPDINVVVFYSPEKDELIIVTIFVRVEAVFAPENIPMFLSVEDFECLGEL